MSGFDCLLVFLVGMPGVLALRRDVAREAAGLLEPLGEARWEQCPSDRERAVGWSRHEAGQGTEEMTNRAGGST